jgi:hypothetical protein
MSVMTWIWLSSIAGALLFAAAGYFAARARAPKRAAKREPIQTGPKLDPVALQRFVDDIVKTPSVRAAALTDELGFLVVGKGENTEALAAFGAYLTDAGARARGLLPLNAVQKVSVEDAAGHTLTAHAVASAPHELVLVTLGSERRP